MKMFRVPALVAAAAVTLLTCAVSNPALAGGGGGATFAQFFQSTANQAFHFYNVNAGSNSFGVFATNPVAVTFEFLKPTTFGAAGTPISATLQFLALTNGAASSSAGLSSESMGQVSMVFTSTSGHVNLLTMTSSGTLGSNPSSAGMLFGPTGGNSAAMAGSTNSGATITYSSSVLSSLSTMSGNKDYSLGLSSLQPAFMVAGDGILQSFKASGAGSFGAPVPEASTMVSFGVLVLGGGLLVFARRKRTAGHTA